MGELAERFGRHFVSANAFGEKVSDGQVSSSPSKVNLSLHAGKTPVTIRRQAEERRGPRARSDSALRADLKWEQNPTKKGHRMDVQTIDQQYAQLQSASQQVTQELKELAVKLQSESAGGNQQAREWVLDLKEIALAIQSQQQQMSGLLQAIHGFVANQEQNYGGGAGAQPSYAQPSYAQQQPGGLRGFLQSGFGRAMEMGVGFGLGDDLMQKLF